MPTTGRSISVGKSVKTDMDLKLDKIELLMQLDCLRVGEIYALLVIAKEVKKKRL